MANRQYKDSVFRKLLHNKNELAQLYQAIRPEDVILAKGDLDLRVHVIDISYDETNPILQTCKPLYGYSYLVHCIQEHQHCGDNDDTAIAKAVNECMDAGILTNFLKKNSREVINMFKLQWNEKDAKKYWMEEGEARGHAEGKAEGKAEAARSLMESLNITKEKAMELLKIPAELQPKVLALL